MASNRFVSKIIGIGAVESSFFYQTTPCISNFEDDDYAPLLVLVEYLCALEVNSFHFQCFRFLGRILLQKYKIIALLNFLPLLYFYQDIN